MPFGASLTGIAKLPPGSIITADEKFSEKPSGWIGFIKFVVVVCFLFSMLNHFAVWDMIILKATGHHGPAFLTQTPDKSPDNATTLVVPKDATMTLEVSTNAPAK